MENEEKLIDLQLCSDKILVWKADDVRTIRDEHHIVGKLIGCLPRTPQQNLQLGLPLQLLPEEAAVLIEYGVARIIKIKIATPGAEDVEKFKEDRQKSFMEQNHIYNLEKDSKKADILKKNQSSFGKKKKQLRKERAKNRKMLLGGHIGRPIGESHASLLLKDSSLSDDLKDTRKAYVNKEGLPSDKSISEGIENSEITEDAGMVKIESVGVGEQAGKINIDDRGNSSCNLERLSKSCKREVDKEDSENNVANKRQKVLADQFEDGHEVSGNNITTCSEQNITQIEHRKLQKGETENVPENGIKNNDSEKMMDVENYANVTDSSVKEKKQTVDNIDSKLNCRDTVCDGLQDNPSCAAIVGKDSKNESVVKNDSEEEEKKHGEEENNTSKGHRQCLIHLPTCAAKFDKIPLEEWNYPSSDTEWLRFLVFKHFWEEGYYLTCGGKFGGDFLVYPGNPMLFHSSFIAICRPHSESFTARELVQFGRMASNVKKTVIICSLDTQDKLVFTSVQWTGIS
ncbi:tRNA-splicing endonuclease subunit Sen34-like [Anneissia japonica]|uniref:tRNA-splicing endonuclease subunit Sen34-like n=1 Tax=Anneissia japonica TaxID=1529436 RepID=UPI00142569FE|nr:tRNA-splicing endonuclease subunit Sen34-like [Anneissia japonica]